MSHNWKSPYKASMRFHDYIINNNDNISSKKIEHLWHDAFNTILKSFNFNRKARDYMWEELVRGNWKRLHLTEDEKSLSSYRWLDQLMGEVWYCSDRWSLDRLTRCHWLFRNYIESL
jgi:hypothetical protein